MDMHFGVQGCTLWSIHVGVSRTRFVRMPAAPAGVLLWFVLPHELQGFGFRVQGVYRV